MAWQDHATVLGEVVGNYRITAKLAEGGMGAVFRAEHTMLGKPAAVKVLLPELSNNREIVNRFFNEARAATSVRHPGIVEIFDFGYMPSGLAYIVMELLDGESLSRVLVARGRLSEQEALVYTRGIASALAPAHAQGIVHRDLKPDNIFLVRDPDMAGGWRPKILDFGIAKVAEAQRGPQSTKTRTGSVLGTPTYMSPEQCRGTGDVDHRSDLYSVGCILYEMLCGRPPFASEGLGEVLGMHLYMPPTPPSELGLVISQGVEQLVLQLLQKRPEDRVQSANDLARLLGQGSMSGMVAAPGAPTVAGLTPMPLVRTPPPLLTPAPAYRTGGGQPGGATAPGNTSVSAPTTLSAAAGASAAEPRKSRAGLFAVLGLVVAGGAAAAVFALGGGGGGGGSEDRDPAGTPPPVAVDAGTPPVDAAPAPIDATEEPVDAAAPPVDAAIDAPDKPRKRKRGNGNGQKDDGSGGIDRGD
jgi:hypothetical protein